MTDVRRPKAFIVSHTHWDREWYLPFHRFRLMLGQVVRQVLDLLEGPGPFEHFLLDGQSIVLEDHLALHPGDRERIEALVRAGKLSVGPWYILPDEFLVSGESTLRNLLIGHAVGRDLGGVQKVGYMPDSFGHIAQMPQILRSAGIDSFVFTRGSGDELDETGLEFRWRGPDGSELLAIQQWGGYCNAASLGHEEIWHAHTQRRISIERAVARVGELLGEMDRRSKSDLRLLNNGCDHFPPQRDFDRVLAALRGAYPKIEFLHASLGDYVAALRDAGTIDSVHSGDLLAGKYHHILSGVWSTRSYLKQRNDRCEELLTGSAEPLAAYAHFCLGLEYPGDALDDGWKLLLKNHPHDSICGCSTDEVHREMIPRFDGVEQTAEQLIATALERIAPTFAGSVEDDGEIVLCVANTHPAERTAVVERLVVLQPPAPDPSRLRLTDESGAVVPCEIVEARHVERFWGVDYRKELDGARQLERFDVYKEHFGRRILRDETRRDDSDCYVTIRFAASLPALGHASFFLTEGEPLQPQRAVIVEQHRMANACLAVELFPDGTLDVEDRRSGERWSGLNVLESTEDTGDEYDYCPAKNTLTVTSREIEGGVRVLRDGALSCTLEAEYLLPVPVGLDGERKRRRQERVGCRVRTRVTLTGDEPLVDVETLFDNRARDHRLRVEMPSGLSAKTVLTDGPFLVQARPLEQPRSEGWVQPPPGTYPQREFSAVENGERGLALLNRGLPEIEARSSEDGPVSLFLTLLRGVDWLSRDDFETRGRTNAGPTLHTPDAQCLGEHRFHYALAPYSGNWIDAGIREISRRWRTPALTIQGVRDGLITGGVGLLRKETGRTSISAIKRHEQRGTLVVRLYNLTGENIEETLTFGVAVSQAWKTDVLEERRDPLESTGREVTVPIGPHEIATVEVEVGG